MLSENLPGSIIPHIPSTMQYSYYGVSGYTSNTGFRGVSGYSGIRINPTSEYDPQYSAHKTVATPLCTDKNWQNKLGSEKPKKKHWLAKLWRV